MEKQEQLTPSTKLILASSSQTRISYLKKYFSNFKATEHFVDEDEIKKKIKSPLNLVLYLAKEKALSVSKIYPDQMVIGSDQVLVCNNKLINKPKDLSEAEKNLIYLNNKKHNLLSAIYVLKKGKRFFQKVSTAELLFNKISIKQIKEYISQNPKTALSTVGSYKIEENDKFKFLKVLSGDLETIIGFPIKDFLKKVIKNV